MSMVTANEKDGALLIQLQGRIDSGNAEQVGAEIDAIRAEHTYESITLDAQELAYISSAGLRAVLRLRKMEPTLKIINASSEVYDIFEMTGFTEMIPVEKAYRQFSVDGCEVIGRGAKGTVYRYDPETVVKVYKDVDCLPDIQRERELARKAFVYGVPTAISYDVVKVGECFGSVFELLDAKSLSMLIAEDPEHLADYAKRAADLLRLVHSTEVKPEDMPSGKKNIAKWIDAAEAFLTAEEMTKLRALADAIPEQHTMLHFDYHTNNVMAQGSEDMLIDIDTLCYGHPVLELANTFVAYIALGMVDPVIEENFLGFSYETATKFWDLFLRAYLQTDDEAKIADVERKVELLGYTRTMRHFARRGAESGTGREMVELCRKKISALLQSVDSLTF